MMYARGTLSAAFVVLLSALVVQVAPMPATAIDCSPAASYREGQVPLTDLGDDTYEGETGGLYPGGSNVLPNDHQQLGLELAQQVAPRSTTGAISASGKIGFLSIGVSNTSSEFRAFMDQQDPARDETVVSVNGAQGGAPVTDWIDPDASTWNVVAQRIADAGLSPQQVQVAWVKLPERDPSEPFPIDANTYSDDLTAVLGALHSNYPSVKIAYLSSRIYGGYGDALSPEPWAYQHGFGVKWTIEAQILGDPNLNPDPSAGAVEAPWIAWGPYMWANGAGSDLEPGGVPGRSDGLEWLCHDFADDGIHPSHEGSAKVAALLTDFLHSDATACSWYLADADCEPPSTTPDLPFLDIADSTFVADIIWLAAEGITKGCNPPDNDLFCPDDDVTRGQMAAFLTRALNLPAGPDAFTDDESSTFEEDINAIAKAGITLGCNPPDNDLFCPDDDVTRGQMAAFLTRALNLPAGPDAFTDDETSTFENDINAIAKAGITFGCNPPDNDHFCPNDEVTRGQMAAFLHRASEFLSS